LKDHGEHSRATSPPATSHILSRMGTDAVEIGRSQDSKRKRSFMPFPLDQGHLCQQDLSEINILSVLYPYLILNLLTSVLVGVYTFLVLHHVSYSFRFYQFVVWPRWYEWDVI